MAAKHIIPLKPLIELDELRYKKAKAAIRRVRQIADGEEFEEFRKTGVKLAAFCLSEVLNGEVKIIGEEVKPELIIENSAPNEEEMV